MENRFTHLKHPIILMGISLFLTICIGYLDEGNYSLAFLSNPGEIGPLLFFTILFSAVPVVLYHYFLTTRANRYSFVLALSGFLPPFILILLLGSAAI